MDIYNNVDIIVIGAGPAGMMAAGQAALSGAKVLLLEKTDSVGKKLSITGKKRCNLTNSANIESFINHFGHNGQFLRQAFHQFFRDELIEFLKILGIETETERGGRIFPSNGDAAFVTNRFAEWCRSVGVDVMLLTPVERLIVRNGKMSAIETREKKPIHCKTTILCTGGATFVGTGSTGDGYRMAEAIGHTLIPIRPALVPMKTSGRTAQRLQGLSLRNIKMTIFFDQKKHIETSGEMLFTHFGISGPIVLTHSGEMVDTLRAGKEVSVSIDLKPALDAKKLDKRLLRELDAGGKKHVRTILKNLLPSKMIPVCADICKLELESPCHQITSEDRRRLLTWMKDIRLNVTAPLSLETGMVTMGGVSLNEIDPRTMMSKKVEGLYFAGEILDLAGDTGGYNLQSAFSTGWLAGKKAAAYCLVDK